MPTTVAQLLSDVSIEVTPREPGVARTVLEHFGAGLDVHVTFLPDDDMQRAAETCGRLREAGFEPIPHLTARNFANVETLRMHLARLRAEASVKRALVIAGDVAKPRGEFSASIEVIGTGLLEANGIGAILVAGHPEGHPAVTDEVMAAALREKIAAARAHGIEPTIVTQFGFEAEPICRWILALRRAGIDVPVRIGVAGPASTAALLKFAMRCGVGNSLRALRTRGGAIGKLMGETTPDALIADLARLLTPEHGAIAGLHLYIFGGIRKTATWLNEARRAASTTMAPLKYAGQ